eukprot:1149594-Pelagomonas_calceolata.AAC.2
MCNASHDATKIELKQLELPANAIPAAGLNPLPYSEMPKPNQPDLYAGLFHVALAEENFPHQLRERRHIDSEEPSPPPQGYRPESANGDLEDYWKHPDPGPGCEKYFLYSIARLVVFVSHVPAGVDFPPPALHCLAPSGTP